MFNNGDEKTFRKTSSRSKRLANLRGDNTLGDFGRKSSSGSLRRSLSDGLSHHIKQNILNDHSGKKQTKVLSRVRYSPEVHSKVGDNNYRSVYYDSLLAEYGNANTSAIPIPLDDGDLFGRVGSGRKKVRSVIAPYPTSKNEYDDFGDPVDANILNNSYGGNLYSNVRNVMSSPYKGDSVIPTSYFAPKPISTGNTEATLKYVRKVEIELMMMQERDSELCEALWTSACEKAVLILERSEAQERQELVTEPESSAREMMSLWFHNTIYLIQQNYQTTLEKELRVAYKQCRKTSGGMQLITRDNNEFGSNYQSRESESNRLHLTSSQFLNSESTSISAAISELQIQLQEVTSEVHQLNYNFNGHHRESDSQFHPTLSDINSAISECLAVVRNNEEKHDVMKNTLDRLLRIRENQQTVDTNGRPTAYDSPSIVYQQIMSEIARLGKQLEVQNNMQKHHSKETSNGSHPPNITSDITDLLDKELKKYFNANHADLDSIKKEIKKIDDNSTMTLQTSMQSMEMKIERSLSNLNSLQGASCRTSPHQTNDISTLISMTEEILNVIKRGNHSRINYTNDSASASESPADAAQRVYSDSAIHRAFQYRRLQDSWSEWVVQSLDLFLDTKKQTDHIFHISYMTLFKRSNLTNMMSSPAEYGISMKEPSHTNKSTLMRPNASKVADDSFGTNDKKTVSQMPKDVAKMSLIDSSTNSNGATRNNDYKPAIFSESTPLRQKDLTSPKSSGMTSNKTYNESLSYSSLLEGTLSNTDFDYDSDETKSNKVQDSSKACKRQSPSTHQYPLGDASSTSSSDSSDDDNLGLSRAIRRNNNKIRAAKKGSISVETDKLYKWKGLGGESSVREGTVCDSVQASAVPDGSVRTQKKKNLPMW